MQVRAAKKPMRRRSGFAAVDAMVALTLVSITLAFCMMAGVSASRLSHRADEFRQAEALSRRVLAASANQASGGRTNGLNWQVMVVREQAPARPELSLCRKLFSAIGERSGRRYEWQALAPCPPETHPL